MLLFPGTYVNRRVNSSIFLNLGIISKMPLLLFFHLHFTSCLSTFSSHFKVPDLSPDCSLSPFQEGFPFLPKGQERTPLQQSAVKTWLPTCDLSLSSSAEKLRPFGKVSHTTASFPRSLRWVLTKGPEMCIVSGRGAGKLECLVEAELFSPHVVKEREGTNGEHSWPSGKGK